MAFLRPRRLRAPGQATVKPPGGTPAVETQAAPSDTRVDQPDETPATATPAALDEHWNDGLSAHSSQLAEKARREKVIADQRVDVFAPVLGAWNEWVAKEPRYILGSHGVEQLRPSTYSTYIRVWVHGARYINIGALNPDDPSEIVIFDDSANKGTYTDAREALLAFVKELSAFAVDKPLVDKEATLGR